MNCWHYSVPQIWTPPKYFPFFHVPALISLYHRKKGSRRMDTHYYLCDLLVSRLLILDSWLNSTRSPVFVL
jgi:hypothetical protein